MATKEQKAKWKAAGERVADSQKEERHGQNRRDLIIGSGGVLLVTFGLVLTVISYTRAGEGGSFVFMWGPVVFGLGMIGKALIGRS